MDRFLSMQAFVNVAETASFAETAKRLRISRSVTSERVRQLEALIGAPLLFRSTREVRLSELGERLLPEYRTLVRQFEDIENGVDLFRASLTGRLRIASVTDIGIHNVAPAIASFVALHPQLTIELITDNRVINPVESGFDIAFHVRQPQATDLHEETMATLSSIYCASASYLTNRATIARPGDLRDHDCLNYSLQPNFNEWTLTRAGRVERVKVPFRLASNSGQVLRTYALAGQGIAVLPWARVANDIATGRLVEILAGWSAPTLRLTATYPRSHGRTRKVQAFLEHFRSSVQHLER